ncbi:MAG: SGNH/GDSL hydrolase family protein [Eubacteriales bacterium]
MDFGSNFGKPKKIVYSVITVIVIILASFTILLTMTGLFNNINNVKPSDITQTPPESINETQITPETEQITENVTEPETTPITESVTEPVTEPVTESPETENIILPDPDDSSVSPFIKQLKDIESTYPDSVLALTEDMGDEYINRIVFLGDSTTYGLKKYGVLTDGTKTKQVWTPVSGTLTLSYATFSTILYPDDGSEIIIKDAVSKRKPDILVITLGINGVSFMDETYFKSEYTKLILLIQEASPDTKIILQSIFPVAKSYVNKKSINNEKIVNANIWIASIANETGVKYANTASVLIGSDGYLPEEYQNGDGLHLNEISFAIELNYLRTHAYPEDSVLSEINEEITEEITEP